MRKKRQNMKTIKSALFAVAALLALTSASSAMSLNGVYLEAGTSAIGAAAEGTHTDTGSNSTTVGSVGKTAVTVSYGLGFMTDRSRRLGLDLGYMWTPGEAKIKSTSDDTESDVTFEISDSTEYYLAPMINITEDASIFLKYSQNSSDIKVTGDVTKPTSMDGTTVAVGTIMSWGSNLYIRTEAGMTDYDSITVTGLGETAGGKGVGTDQSVRADNDVNYGKIAIGYKF
jgi:hypothetical protein